LPYNHTSAENRQRPSLSLIVKSAYSLSDFLPICCEGKKIPNGGTKMNMTIKEILQARHEGLFLKSEARKMYDEYKEAGIQ
jgi:hypothetical protein